MTIIQFKKDWGGGGGGQFAGSFVIDGLVFFHIEIFHLQQKCFSYTSVNVFEVSTQIK